MLKKLSCIILSILIIITFTACKSEEVDLNKLSCYEINAEFNDSEMSLTADMNFEYYNSTGKEITQLKFNLYGNAYRDDAKIKPISENYKSIAYPNGNSYGKMDILSVTENENSLNYTICGIDNNILEVTLVEGVFPSERVKINIDFKLTLAQIMHRTGYNNKTINLGNWFPILCVNTNEGYYECPYYSSGDPFYSDCANYTVNFKVKKSYVAAASGEYLGVSDEGEYNNYLISVKGVRDFALVLSKDFSVMTQKVLNTTIYYYYYDDENAENTLKVATESFKYFSEKFGEYPYNTLSVVKTGFCYGGMEYPCLTMISDNLTDKQYIQTIVHENSHQWWYGLVGNNQSINSWMDEGLAEYSTVLFFENYEEYGISSMQLISSAVTSYKTYYNIYSQLHGEVNTSMNRSLSEFISEYEYMNIAYKKSLLMFDNLRISIGDKKFYLGLNNYFKKYKYKNAAPENLIGCFEKIGADTNEYFNSWIDGKVLI
jgi:hypothetical protein